MNSVDITKSRNKKWLHLKASPISQAFNLLFRFVFRGITWLMLAILMNELFGAVGFGFVLLFAVLSGLYELINDYKLSSKSNFNWSECIERLEKNLELEGFEVKSKSDQLLIAERTENRVHISDKFYAIKNGSGLLYCSVIELPFPFSFMTNYKLNQSLNEVAGIANK